MDVREKLVELLGNIYLPMMCGPDTIGEYRIPHKFKKEIASHLIAHGVTVQEWISVKERLPQEKGERRMIMKKYHVATGDGKAYYGVGYESYREAEGVLKISQMHDPQAHIVEEEYHFTNADRIRAMSDKELASWLAKSQIANIAEELKIAHIPWEQQPGLQELTAKDCLEWLKQPAEGE